MALHGTPADEADVLRVVLTALGIGPKQVVHATTNLGMDRNCSTDEWKRRVEDWRHEWKDLEQGTLEDFVAKNIEAHPVAPALTLDGRLIPVSDEELRRIFRGDDGWERFREAYPESSGNVEFSRVGFNAGLTQAMFYAGMQRDWLMGMGRYWLLGKNGGKWVETGSTMAWIS